MSKEETDKLLALLDQLAKHENDDESIRKILDMSFRELVEGRVKDES